MAYFIDRLTAPDPKWELAILYCKGIPDIPVGKGYHKWRHVEDWIIVEMPGVNHPDPRAHATADLEVHIHFDEIVRIDFFSNVKALPPEKKPAQGGIELPTQNEIDAAKTGKLARA